MNIHGRRFQVSIDMVELQGLTETNGTVSIKNKNDTLANTTIRELILQHSTDDQPTLLLVSNKWDTKYSNPPISKKRNQMPTILLRVQLHGSITA